MLYCVVVMLLLCCCCAGVNRCKLCKGEFEVDSTDGWTSGVLIVSVFLCYCCLQGKCQNCSGERVPKGEMEVSGWSVCVICGVMCCVRWRGSIIMEGSTYWIVLVLRLFRTGSGCCSYLLSKRETSFVTN